MNLLWQYHRKKSCRLSAHATEDRPCRKFKTLVFALLGNGRPKDWAHTVLSNRDVSMGKVRVEYPALL